MNSLDGSSVLLGLSVLGALDGAILCLVFLWMLRQQKFLQELFRTLHDLERSNREAQRDLFLLLRSYLGFQETLTHDQVEGADLNNRSAAPQYQESRTGRRSQELTLDENERRLLMVLARQESKSLAAIRKSVKGFNDLEVSLRSLQDKGLIFYSVWSDVVVILPKAFHYLGLAPFPHTPATSLDVNPETTVAKVEVESQKAAANSARSERARPSSLFSLRIVLLSLLVACFAVLCFVWQKDNIGVLWQRTEEPLPPEPLLSEVPTENKEQTRQEEQKPSEASPSSEEALTLRDTVPAPSEAPPTTLSPSQPEQLPVKVPHLLRIQAKERTWIYAIIDSKQTKDVLLNPGEEVKWSAREGFVLTVGNAGGITLIFDTRELPPLGVSGQVVRNLQLPPPEAIHHDAYSND